LIIKLLHFPELRSTR